ncbi:MAG: hypothetical protein R3E96_14375 [Planctomycetota bacterium]
MVGRTGTSEAITALAQRILKLDPPGSALLADIAPRMDSATIQHAVRYLLAQDVHHVELAMRVAGEELGFLGSADLRKMPTYAWFTKRLRHAGAENRVQLEPVESRAVGAWLRACGLLADQDAARLLVDELCGLGLSPHDPLLALMQFNAALPAAPFPPTPNSGPPG